MSSGETKPTIEQKSSMEILSELFGKFDAEPPLIIKKEKSEKKHKKSKKSKKSKKHKKKSKKSKKSDSSDDDSSSDSDSDIVKNIKLEKIKSEIVKHEKNKTNVSSSDEESKPVLKSEKIVNGHSKDGTDNKKKIAIKDLSEIFTSTIKEIHKKVNDTELDLENIKIKTEIKSEKSEKKRSRSRDRYKRKHSDKDNEDKSKRHRSSRDSKDQNERDRSRHSEKEKDRRDSHKSSDKDRHRERSSERHSSKYGRDRTRDRSDIERLEHRAREKYRDRDDEYEKELQDYRKRRNPFYRDEKSSRSRDTRDRPHESDRSYRGGYDRHDDRHRRERDRGPTRDVRDARDHIDKKKLLEIARKNAITMMKSGSLPAALTLGPQAQEKVIAAIKAGGKTVDELTDFCKTLSKKEELGDLSSNSEKGNDSDSEAETAFHHPFQIKDRPTSITMNIKNSVPLPIKSTVERTSELRIQFPVSSGQSHRTTEGEWVPVSPKKNEATTVALIPKSTTSTVAATTTAATAAPAVPPLPAPLPVAAPLPPPPEPPKPLAVVPAPANAPPGPQVFPTPALEPSVDIGSIVSQRLTAMRKLQENPNDVVAITQIYKSNKEMQSWAQSKQQPGQFTGSTGVKMLTQAELASGYQAWAKKDQLQTAAPVSGGMGMHLLQKMGWKPGEGLGKEKSGTLEPLLLEIKLDKKGLVANEEQSKKRKGPRGPTVKTLAGKHPVSLLGEFASKRKLGAPQYILCFECGPDHKKNFLFKVLLNGKEYKPNVASQNKKEAKAAAAALCLEQIGLVT